MTLRNRLGMTVLWVGLACAPALAQPAGTTAPPDPLAGKTAVPPPPAATAVAANVNGQPIPELAIYRVLKDEPLKNWAEARAEILDFLVGNILVDQYLLKMNVSVDAKEVEKRLDEMKKEADKEKQDWTKLLQSMFLTEAELRQQLTCALRWDKYCEQQGTEKALRDLFDNNHSLFDGSQVQARHILIQGKGMTPEQARAKIAALKNGIETKAAQELAALPPQTTAIERDKARMKALEKAFGEAAVKESDCPSKQMQGDLGWFPRQGAMVEPFARAAFALKPYELSDAVVTEFGYHLILSIDHKQGKDVKYEDVRAVVREVFADRLREALVSALKARSQIAVAPAPKY